MKFRSILIDPLSKDIDERLNTLISGQDVVGFDTNVFEAGNPDRPYLMQIIVLCKEKSDEEQEIPETVLHSDPIADKINEEFFKTIDDYVTKSTFNYQFKKLKDEMEQVKEYLDLNEIHYRLSLKKPMVSVGRGPQFDMVLINPRAKKDCAVLRSYWNGKEIISTFISKPNGYDKQILDKTKTAMELYLPEYSYRFEEGYYKN